MWTYLKMYSWRCFFAIVLVIVWYLSEFGQVWTQAFFCFFCLFSFPLKSQEREKSTQTHNLKEITTKQIKKCHHVGVSDEPDSAGKGQNLPQTPQYPYVQKSLLQASGLFEECDKSTQTDDLKEKTTQQTKKCHHVGVSDEPDAAGKDQNLPQTVQYPYVQKSLLQVFKCAYANLVQPWYTPPELGESQPLNRALHEEFNLVVARIMCKAKNFDLSATSVGCVRILTRHLHNAKQSDSSPMFSSRSEEMAALRSISEALVRNLFPEYLWEPKLYQCVLTEIVAMKALDVLVSNLCNPDNLNQMLVSQLDEVSSKSSRGELRNLDREGTPSSTCSEGSELLTDEAEGSQSEEIKEKKRGNKLKEKFSKFVDKVKSKNPTKKKLKKEKVVLQRALSARRSVVIEGACLEGSIGSYTDSDNESNQDVYLTSVQEDRMEFKLSYEMWRVGKWAVRVTNVQKENDELCFTVHVEESNNPENLYWDVRKAQSDILDLYSLLQDTSGLPSISTIVEKSKTELDDTYTEDVRSALENFLQVLVSDAQLGHSQPVFQFLCPLARLLCNEEHEGGLWSLLSGLANFLTPGQHEDESHNPKRVDKLDEAGATVNRAEQNAAQPACIDTAEESDGSTKGFCTPHNSELDREDSNQMPDEPESASDGQESLAESIDSFVHRSKLLTPAANSNDAINHNEGLQADTSDDFKSCNQTKKKEKLAHKKSNELQKFKEKEKTGEATNQPQEQKKEQTHTTWEQLEAPKAIFDLLKEVTGNSVFINICVDAILKPFMPLVKKKVNNFLNKMNPTEVQIASYIDTFRERMWSDGETSVQPPRDSKEKHETKERALQLINSKYSNALILKKTDVETVFKIFQDTDENKKLVYMLLSYVLGEFLPGEPAFKTIANVTVKDFVSQ